MKDILLLEDGDLYVDDTGDIRITDSVRQAVRVRLRWFFDEWRLGPEYGVPYYEDVLIKNPNPLRVSQVIRDEVMTVDEVTDVRNIEVKIDARNRTAKVTMDIVTQEETAREELMIVV
jgi:hypothetical protein